MTGQRKDEIIRQVIYNSFNFMPFDTIDTTSAFHVGRMMGVIQKQLECELAKEVEE